MLTVITGIPGSGKTLYTVDKLLRPILKTTIKHTAEDDTVSEVPRRIFSNINGLLIEHEKIGAGSPWVYNGKLDRWEQTGKDVLGLNNWHEWCKPGDVIVFDEVQKPWPLAATGSKVPPYIEALETHRHMGVDFILMTQHPMMIHSNIVRLCGRHLHMRRLGNMSFATVYEWDGCSRTLIYKSCMAKFPYRYGKSAFELYKSAEAHTKQPRKIPSLIYGIIFAALGLLVMGPTVSGRLTDRLNPQAAAAKRKAEENAKQLQSPSPVVFATSALVPSSVPTPVSQPLIAPRVVAGCIASKSRCSCYDEAGKMVITEQQACQRGSYVAGVLVSESLSSIDSSVTWPE